MSVPLQICNGTNTKWYMCQNYTTYATSAKILFFCVWCGICAKYLAFGTYPTSTVGALSVIKENKEVVV